MSKLIGAVLIFAACTASGMSAAAVYRQRVIQLEAFTALIAHIGAQISVFLTPLDHIYAEFRNAALEKCGFIGALKAVGGVSALDECRRRIQLTDDEVYELERFFAGLGHSSAQEEARHCAYFEKRIGELAASARGTLASKMRICRVFGMLTGVMLAVMLL